MDCGPRGANALCFPFDSEARAAALKFSQVCHLESESGSDTELQGLMGNRPQSQEGARKHPTCAALREW